MRNIARARARARVSASWLLWRCHVVKRVYMRVVVNK